MTSTPKAEPGDLDSAANGESLKGHATIAVLDHFHTQRPPTTCSVSRLSVRSSLPSPTSPLQLVTVGTINRRPAALPPPPPPWDSFPENRRPIRGARLLPSPSALTLASSHSPGVRGYSCPRSRVVPSNCSEDLDATHRPVRAVLRLGRRAYEFQWHVCNTVALVEIRSVHFWPLSQRLGTF